MVTDGLKPSQPKYISNQRPFTGLLKEFVQTRFPWIVLAKSIKRNLSIQGYGKKLL